MELLEHHFFNFASDSCFLLIFVAKETAESVKSEFDSLDLSGERLLVFLSFDHFNYERDGIKDNGAMIIIKKENAEESPEASKEERKSEVSPGCEIRLYQRAVFMGFRRG